MQPYVRCGDTHKLRILMLLLLMDDDTAGADVEAQRGQIEGDAETNGQERGRGRE